MFSSRLNETRVTLLPDSKVRIDDDGWTALATPFWLRIEPSALLVRHKWIRIHYSSSLFDEPVRPLIRFITADGREWIRAMNGPTLGRAIWLGAVPPETVEVSISPARRMGQFSFRIDRIEPVSSYRLLCQALRHDPGGAIWAIRSQWAGFQAEAGQSLRNACGGTPLDRYDRWYAQRIRPYDHDGLDRPRTNWTAGPIIRLMMALRGDNVLGLEATIASCRAQVYRRWSLSAIVGDGSSNLLAAYHRAMDGDARLSLVPALEGPHNAARATNMDWHAVIGQGDTLSPYALAVIAEHLAVSSELSLIYTDEDSAAPNGNLHSPIFKPDWSPLFQERVPYVGRLCAIRGDVLAAADLSARDLVLDEAEANRALLHGIERGHVGHVRRPLYRRLMERQRAHELNGLEHQIRSATMVVREFEEAPPMSAVLVETRPSTTDL